jgi:hypothetical protein
LSASPVVCKTSAARIRLNVGTLAQKSRAHGHGSCGLGVLSGFFLFFADLFSGLFRPCDLALTVFQDWNAAYFIYVYDQFAFCVDVNVFPVFQNQCQTIDGKLEGYLKSVSGLEKSSK